MELPLEVRTEVAAGDRQAKRSDAHLLALCRPLGDINLLA
jgi:hypothetical protein